MARTHDIGYTYWHTIVYGLRPKELFERAESQEIERPFRKGRGIAIRLPFTRLGLVIGRWKDTHFDEGQALTYAVNGRGLTTNEVDWDYIRYGAKNESTVQEA